MFNISEQNFKAMTDGLMEEEMDQRQKLPDETTYVWTKAFYNGLTQRKNGDYLGNEGIVPMQAG